MFSENIKKVFLIIFVLTMLFNSVGAVCGAGLLASPSKFNFNNSQPSQTLSGTVQIKNTGDVPMDIKVDGKRLLMDNIHLDYSDEGIATWISVGVNNFTLDPGEVRSIPFTVTTPAQINYYDALGALVLQGSQSNITSNSQFAIKQNINLVIPIIVGLPGPIVESLQVLQHSAPIILLSYMPGDFTYQLNNNGTVYANMTGSIEINSLLSSHKVPVQGIVYPKDNYTLTAQWTPGFADFGLYSADTNINYGRYQQDKLLQTHDTILVIPVWLIVLLILAGAIWIIRKKEIESPFKIKIERKK